MKAILIDAKNKQVKEVEIDGRLQSWYDNIGCEIVECGMWLDKGDAIMVDEEGLFDLFDSDNDSFFLYEGSHQPFAGNGLIVGTDQEGDTVSAEISVDEVRKKVKFMTRFGALIWAQASIYIEAVTTKFLIKNKTI